MTTGVTLRDAHWAGNATREVVPTICIMSNCSVYAGLRGLLVTHDSIVQRFRPQTGRLACPNTRVASGPEPVRQTSSGSRLVLRARVREGWVAGEMNIKAS